MSFLDFRKKYKVPPTPNLREPSFEECIDAFINKYLFINNLNPDNDTIDYSAFISIFCDKEEDIGSNFKEQQKLMQLVKQQGYQTAPQISDDRIIFIHISGKDGLNEKKDLDMVKLYINCDRKNISLITNLIFQKIRIIVGTKLQLKCISEQYVDWCKEAENNSVIKNYQRNDKIVIYAENPHMAELIAEQINELRREHPELFSSEKTLPFIPKKYGFIGFVSKKSSDYARTPLGIASGSTYNDYISNLIFCCTISGFDKYFGIDSHSNRDNVEERMIKYAELYQNMTQTEKSVILRNIKEIFEQVSRDSNVQTSYFTPVESDAPVQE